MEGFAVDPAGLRLLAARLDDVNVALRAAAARANDVGTGSTGHRGLEGALARFADHWEHGIRQLADNSHAVAAQLRASADGYVGVDEAVRSACD